MATGPQTVVWVEVALELEVELVVVMTELVDEALVVDVTLLDTDA